MTQESTLLGGVGRIVQINESVVYKPKYHLGCGFKVPVKWIFGMYDVAQKIVYMQFVESRDTQTLLPIIGCWVSPGTAIHSDEGAAYRNIWDIDVTPRFIHMTVNHSCNFIDTQTGAHTNNIKAYWSSVKQKVKILNGTSRALTAGYLDEHMYLQWFGESPRSAFENTLLHIAKYSLVD
jgi:hypothetical protein